MKKWTIHAHYGYYAFGLLVYAIGLSVLAVSYKYEDMAVASVMIVMFNIITLLIFGAFYFRENLTIYEVSGIFLALGSIVLLEIGKS